MKILSLLNYLKFASKYSN